MDKIIFEKLKSEAVSSNIAIAELDYYKVDNAIILAAGISDDTMYSPPKGLLKMNGIPIIERQIEQLIQAEIKEIYIVVGYKKEMYFYLEDKYEEVKLIGNPRLDKNNVYSLYLAREHLKNTYVCSCDYYYKNNPFSKYEYESYQATSFLENANSKFVIKTNSKNRITKLIPGAQNGECINGLAFFNKEFSDTLKNFLEYEINDYRVSSLFWEEFVEKHFEDLDLYSKHFEEGESIEFDDLNSLKTLNTLFVNSVSTEIVDNICKRLSCESSNISSVDILEAGHSNITFKVTVNDKDYVYRYPGVSGKNIVSRTRETHANKIAKELDIDKTLIFIDESGHKISTFVPNAHPLNKQQDKDLAMLASCVKKLHDNPVQQDIAQQYEFNPIAEADRLLNLACSNKDNLFDIFSGIRENVHKINLQLEKDNFKKAICHCNLNSNNCLITNEGFDLIDWEFSGYCDIAYDFPFLGNYDFEIEDLEKYLEFYYNRKPTKAEFEHWLCYRAVHYWYYTCWAIYKESVNEDCGNLLLVFYNQCKKTVKIAKNILKNREVE